LQLLNIHQAAQWINQGELSPFELTQALLRRIERLEPRINAFITLTPELALEQARLAEAELQRGELRGPLHGIPLALKDLYETAGVRTTAGSQFFRDFVPQTDSATVAKLKQAGVIILGKLNMHEIALGLTNENPHFGVCHNPWDLERITGGSSGGSAAALAAGFCLGALGSDTGGSIRVPAALCGVVGLKPTFGRVSLRGVIPLSNRLDHAGPMARCVKDLALLLQAMAGYDPEDPYCQDATVVDYSAQIEGGIKDWRVAFASGRYFQDIDLDVWARVESAARIFADLGASVEMVETPEFEEAAWANSVLVSADAAEFHKERLATRPDLFGADVRQRLSMGAVRPLSEYIQAGRVQAVFRRKMEAMLNRYDLLLLPTTAVPALELGREDAVQRASLLTRFTSPFNLSGIPALSLPCGFVVRDSVELPVGLQIVARPWAEARLLRGAFVYEQATGWHLRYPDFDEQM
jgi:aspartyl-tRNA(Asn)/glutamyl-tRNA(Gln) amidotransferase subunit A